MHDGKMPLVALSAMFTVKLISRLISAKSRMLTIWLRRAHPVPVHFNKLPFSLRLYQAE